MFAQFAAVLLILSPAAGPVDQLCISWDSTSEASCQRQQVRQQQQQIDDQQRQIDDLRQRERQRQNEYTAPGVSLPGNYTAPGVSTSSSGGSCALCTSAGFR